jgi:hypothetical protein
MKYTNKWLEEVEIRTFDDLREYAAERGEDAIETINRFWRRARRKTIDNQPFWAFINPWGEIRRLRAFIWAMRAEETRAAKNALDLYAENDALRRYKELAEGHMSRFVPADDHRAVKKELEKTRAKLSSVSLALDEQMEAWTAYMKSAPTRPAKAK